jgi:hypothetical protein
VRVLTCNEAASVCKFMAEYKPVLLNEGLESLDGPENYRHTLHRLQREVEKNDSIANIRITTISHFNFKFVPVPVCVFQRDKNIRWHSKTDKTYSSLRGIACTTISVVFIEIASAKRTIYRTL